MVCGWADASSMSAYTKHPQQAWDWVMFMAGPGRPVDSILGGFAAAMTGIPVLQQTGNADTVGVHDRKTLTVGQLTEAGILFNALGRIERTVDDDY